MLRLNLAALKATNLSLANALESIKPNENIEVFVGKDPLDINYLNIPKELFLFPTSPINSTLELLDAFNEFALHPYLYYFGIGNGVFFKVILNAKHSAIKRLCIIEPDLELLYCTLNLLDFSSEIKSGRLLLYSSAQANSELLAPLIYHHRNALIYSKLYELKIFSAYYDQYQDDIIRINKIFISLIEHAVKTLGNDSKDAITGIRQNALNLNKLIKSPSLHNLIRCSKISSTAVIVSTGPSLHKQLDLLKSAQNYLCILCIDASFPILSKHGIKPDIVFTLERVPLGAKFYEGLECEQEGVIFALTSIVHENVIKAIKGGVKQFSLRPFGYTKYFDLNEYGYIGIGMSAANMAFEFAVHTRFDRCIFIGQDLAFNDEGHSHSLGAVYGSKEITPNSDVLLPAWQGEEGTKTSELVKSTEVWKMFLTFFEKDIRESRDIHPNLEVINATEGGASIKGAKEISFKKALEQVEKIKKTQINLDFPSKETQEKNLRKVKKKFNSIIIYGRKQQKKIEAVFLKVQQKIEELEAIKGDLKALEAYDFSALSDVFSEIERVKKLFTNAKFLEIFNEATQALIFFQELELALITTKNAQDDVGRKAKQIEWLFSHKQWLFDLAGCIDSVCFCIEEAKQYY